MVNRLVLLLLFAVTGLFGCDQTPPVPKHTVAQYDQYCSACHETGAANAPKRGEVETWKKRLRRGDAELLTSIKEGPVAMPPKGGCMSCSDEELLLLVKYLAAPKD